MADRTLTIFGITGQTGLRLAEAALARGWSVRGLARPASVAGFTLAGAAGLELIAGDLSQPDRLDAALRGADAVVIVLGPRPPYTEVFCATATAAILVGMRHSGTRRVACQTGAMVGPGPLTLPFAAMRALYAWRQPAAAQDRIEQERLVMTSGLDWTLVKPPRLTDGPPRGHVQAGADLRPGLLSSLARRDLAGFVLDAIDQPALVGARVYLRG